MTETLVLADEHIAGLVQRYGLDEIMDRVIHALRETFQRAAGERGITPAREGFTRNSGTGVLEWMAHQRPGESITVKTVSYSPLNPVEYGMPTIGGVLSRFDDATGRLTALCDGVFPTAVRTGAASAVASDVLAPRDSRVLGLIGAGAQAVTQAHALSRLFPLTDILVYDIDDARMKSFADRVGFLGQDVRTAERAELESSSDIICTATSVAVGAGPVLTGDDLRPGVHINAIGADLPGKVELPVRLLEQALVVPDHLDQARNEGECQQLRAEAIGPTLHDLFAQPEPAGGYRERTTVFDSTGTAIEDHVALDVLIELATEAGIGHRMQLEHVLDDVVNPYSVAREPAA